MYVILNDITNVLNIINININLHSIILAELLFWLFNHLAQLNSKEIKLKLTHNIQCILL